MNEPNSEPARVLLAAGDAAGLEALRPTREILDDFAVAWSEALVTRTDAGSLDLAGMRAVIVASADGVLPSAFAAVTNRPVVRVPVASADCVGIALLHDPATGDLPAADAPFATVAIGEAGAKNAALFVISVLALNDPSRWAQWLAFRQRQTDAVLGSPPLSTR